MRVAWLPGLLLSIVGTIGAVAAVLPDGFQPTVVFDGLTLPTAVRFAPDGRVFVAEKGGEVKIFSAIGDTSADQLIDLDVVVHDFWDRGLLGLAIDPDFPTKPYVYVFYTYNASPHGAPDVPLWPDACPTPPGPTLDGCLVDARISRLEVAPNNTLVGGETVLLVNRWCQQYPSHSAGGLVFDDHERTLFAAAGDGASFDFVDYGQGGGSAGSPTVSNPCGDPPSGAGGSQMPPTAEGGALRSQDIRTAGDPVSYDGTLIAIDPDTGGPAAQNPLIGGDPGDDHIVAYGLRNPYRMTFRKETHEIWIGDVGWDSHEEINRVADFEDASVENFGWPCYEGSEPQPGFQAQGLDLCENLYAEQSDPAVAPFYAYQHGAPVDAVPGEIVCGNQGGASITGLAFYDAEVYPASYHDALFFADYSRECLFVILAGADGNPDPATRQTFGDEIFAPVDLQLGPGGLLFWVDFFAGTVVRLDYFPSNQPPQAVAVATPTDGPLDLQVQFDGSSSDDPDETDTLTYAWDLDGDGQFDDNNSVAPTRVYVVEQQIEVGLRVTDDQGQADVDTLSVTAGNTTPSVSIDTPLPDTTWKVGDTIAFSGSAVDAEDGALPAGALEWEILMHHCPQGPGDCHPHPVQTLTGVAQGSFTAPDHEWYSFLELRLTAEDAGFPGPSPGGVLQKSVSLALEPRTVDLTFESEPLGLSLAMGGTAGATPFTRTVIAGSTNSLGAPAAQDLGGSRYAFSAWSDGGAAAHDVVAGEIPATYLATYEYAGVASDWWNTDWRWRGKIVLDNADHFDTLLGFPLLVTLDIGRIDYGLTLAGGADLRFVDDDGTTVLPHEIEAWNENGTSYVWVHVPQIDAVSSSDHIWMYFDNPAAAGAPASADVWSAGFAGVWHLNDGLLDSSGAGNDGTNAGATVAPGRIAAGRQFDGAASIDLGTGAGLAITHDLSVEAWVRIDDPDLDAFMTVLSKKQEVSSPRGYQLEYRPLENLGVILGSGPDPGRADNVDLDASWHHLAATIEGDVCSLYVDGQDVTTDPTCDALAANGLALTIGRRSGGGDHFSGAIDEVRVAAEARRADWWESQFRSMTDTLATYAFPESNCGPIDATCDGFDNDCDGLVDEDTSPPSWAGSLAVERSALTWSAVPSADGYDVIQGQLSTLSDGLGSSLTACIADELAGTTLPHTVDPPPSDGSWFLVRAVNCGGNGSYDSGGAAQRTGRDSAVEASPLACP